MVRNTINFIAVMVGIVTNRINEVLLKHLNIFTIIVLIAFALVMGFVGYLIGGLLWLHAPWH